MCTLVVLQCTGKKVAGGQSMVVNDPFASSLGAIRNHLLATKHSLPYNATVLMPAYKRYGAYQVGNNGGRLYTNIDWPLALQKIKAGTLQIVIESALFGLIEYDTPIPEYDLMMTNAKIFWTKGNLLGKTLEDYIRQRPAIRQVKTFLSNVYFEALGSFTAQGVTYLGNSWIPSDRGANVARTHINPFIASL